MRMNLYAKVLVVASIAAFWIGASASTAIAAEFPKVMKVGHIVAATGSWAWAGKWKMQATQMAVAEINTSGEFPFKLELVFVDHASGDAKKSAAGMRKLVAVHKVPYVITGFNTVTLAAREIGADAHVPCMNGGGLAPELLNKPYLHNTRVMPTQLSVPVTEFLIEKYKAKKVAITYWSDIMGFAQRDAAYYYAPKWGIEVVADICHKPLITDYRSELARVKAAKPDVLAIYSIGNDTAYIRKQALEMGLDIPMGTVLGINPVMIEVCGEKMLKGLYDCSMYFDAKSKLPFCQKFVKNYNARYGEDPERLAANYYELVIVLRDCIRHVLARGGIPLTAPNWKRRFRKSKSFAVFTVTGRWS